MLKLLISLIFVTFSLADIGTIVKVVDGDTVDIKTVNDNIFRARLAYIDTMESTRNAKLKRDVKKYKVIDYKLIHEGLVAKEFLTDYYLNHVVVYNIIKTGKYGRSITYIKGLEEQLVKYGLAKIYDYKDKTTPKELLQLEQEAKDNRLGIWRYIKLKDK